MRNIKKIMAVLALSVLSFSAQAETAGPFNWSSAYMREAPSKIGAAYVSLENPTQSDDALIGASATWAGRIELHQIKTDDKGVMQMLPVSKIDFPKNGTIALSQGGYHLMIFDIKGDLKADEKKDITLKFEKAGPVVIPFTIQPIGAAQKMMHDKMIMDKNHKM